MTTDEVFGPDGAGAPFRPRRGRIMPIVMGTVAVVLCGTLAILGGISFGWPPVDQVLFTGIGVAIAALMFRYASIHATPGPEGLTIRNLLLTRTVDWAEIVGVTFVDGDPWVSLELADTDIVAVMAIQRADGELGRREAARLTTLIDRMNGTAPA